MKPNFQDPKFLKKLILKPEQVIESFNLIYVTDGQFEIVRQKVKEEFRYFYKDEPILKSSEIDRINSLIIPPAWDDVKISNLSNGHLQAFGKDVKNRKQYRYHPIWKKLRNQTKFYKMSIFGTQLHKLRKKVDLDLEGTNWSKDKVIALIIKLMDETHIRIGNEQYARRNKTYGLSTFRKRHVSVFAEKVKFEFIGKRGKEHSITIRNKKLMQLVSKCEEIPGWELFKFYDKSGNKQSVDSGMINEYLHNTTGELFSAKDFRTWAASVVAFDTLFDYGYSTSKKTRDKNIINAYDMAAKALGNTRNVCKKYYVHPFIINSYDDGSIKKYFNKLNTSTQTKKYLSTTEVVMMELLQKYKPKIIEPS